MRVVLTGSSGRVGRAVFSALSGVHDVVGIDLTRSSTTHLIGDFTNKTLLRAAIEGADAVIHVAALHAPHVGTMADAAFRHVNVEGTRLVAQAALDAGIRQLVFTSTTALYGHAVVAGRCSWIDEATVPQPKTIYHRTKRDAEQILESFAGKALAVRVLRMSRCFPEPADVMACYRLHRGVDARDVAEAHVLALTNDGDPFQRHIVSGHTPFTIEDCETLATDAASIIEKRAPQVADAFDRRGWRLPGTIDRVYQSASAAGELGWRSRFGFEAVLAQLDSQSSEILPPASDAASLSE